jgi:NAD(P)-dependent dehydrogenase (short-subunit alcohol dehydrogenase family)
MSSVNRLTVRLRAEVAVVTGASRGIGRAIALALGGEGAKARLPTAMSIHKIQRDSVAWESCSHHRAQAQGHPTWMAATMASRGAHAC